MAIQQAVFLKCPSQPCMHVRFSLLLRFMIDIYNNEFYLTPFYFDLLITILVTSG